VRHSVFPSRRYFCGIYYCGEVSNVLRLSTKDGNQSLDQALADLVRKGLVAKEEAMLKTSNPAKLNGLLGVQSQAFKP